MKKLQIVLANFEKVLILIVVINDKTYSFHYYCNFQG